MELTHVTPRGPDSSCLLAVSVIISSDIRASRQIHPTYYKRHTTKLLHFKSGRSLLRVTTRTTTRRRYHSPVEQLATFLLELPSIWAKKDTTTPYITEHWMCDYICLAYSAIKPFWVNWFVFGSTHNLKRRVSDQNFKSPRCRKGVESWNGSFGQGALFLFFLTRYLPISNFLTRNLPISIFLTRDLLISFLTRDLPIYFPRCSW